MWLIHIIKKKATNDFNYVILAIELLKILSRKGSDKKCALYILHTGQG